MNRALHGLVLGLLATSTVHCNCDESVGGNETLDGSNGGDGGNDNGDGGNNNGDGSTVACISDLSSLVLAPANSMHTIDGRTAAPIHFTATGNFIDGHSETIDGAKLAWSAARADDTTPGEVANGDYQPNPSAGGSVTITATDGCVSAQTSVTFFLDAIVAAPQDAASWNGAPTTDGATPTIVYPSDETRFPRNIYRTLFQWRTNGLGEFRMTFEGPHARVVVFTDGAHALCAGKNPAAGCWEADEATWSLIAGSNAGELITWTVDGLDRSTPTPTVRRGPAIHIGFSRRDVRGAIFYWSTTSKGIRRANIRAAEPEDYLTGTPSTEYPAPNADSIGCVACHVVSRDGRFMAAPVKADTGDSLWIMEVTETSPPTPRVKQVADTRGHGFATISPDDSRVVAAWRGNMWMLDRSTGNKIGDLPLGAMEGTHPDWSPSDTQLAFATGDGDSPGGASIALIPWTSTTSSWGDPRVVVPAEGDRSNLFPMFSPDGRWLAFSRGKGGHGDVQAQLFLVETPSVAAAGTPIDLVRANRVVSNRVTDGLHQNSQPTWAPPGDLAWIAFNSKREYGVVSEGGTQQIWVAAVDLNAASSGDPSFPAFRLQFQGLEEDNHRAFWTLDVREPPDGGVSDGSVSDSGVDGGDDDGGMPDPGGDGGLCREAEDECDPVLDCCLPGLDCDSNDDGLTYVCMPRL